MGRGARVFSVAVQPESLRGVLPEGFTLEEGLQESFSVEILDTFSWGIRASGQVLFRSGASLVLWDQEKANVLSETNGPSEGGFFWWDLRGADFRECLGESAGIRKIERVISLEGTTREFEVFNSEAKVVFRFLLVTLCGQERDGLCSFVGRPLRGYDMEAKACWEALEAIGGGASSGDFLDRALTAAGVTPHHLGGRPFVEIAPGLPAAEALRRVVHPELDLAWKNEPGIIRDTDTEFLHDYRVGLRRARSALGLMSGVYAASDASWIRKQLSHMAAVTNRLRDLDVYLLARKEYEEAVPSVLRLSVRALFDVLSVERASEQRRVAEALLSQRHQRMKHQISGFFARPGGIQPGVESEIPTGAAVALRLGSRYRKIRKLAAAVGAEVPDRELHRLRIHCKKLRYLLEFFSSVAPETSGLLERPLRRLQNRLGAFNDASVQREFLLELWRTNGGGLSPDSSVALGALVGILHVRGAEFRASALRALGALTNPSLVKAVRRRLRPGP